MSANYATLKSVIKTKLEALKDGNDKTRIHVVYDYVENNPSGYPFAIISNEGSEGKVLDTVYNERTFEIGLKVFQEISKQGKGIEEAEDLLTTVQDAILVMLDQDPQLSVNDVATCERVEVVPDKKLYEINDSPLVYIEMTIRCIDLVSRY